ncbi:MAG: HupE/UreJ family protein, partial [Lautropia sp.]|nr:HupE/UreJ family protein [Lautropia sp.]
LGSAWAGLRGIGPACAFAVAAMAATALRVPEVPPALAEAGVAATLLVLAGMLLSRRLPGMPGALALAVAAGLLHGHAFGEAVIGAEATPLLAYLAGLAVIQALMLVLSYRLAVWVQSEHPARVPWSRRIAASLLAAAGTAAMAGALAG